MTKRVIAREMFFQMILAEKDSLQSLRSLFSITMLPIV